MKGTLKLFYCVALCALVASCTQWQFKKIPPETYLAQGWEAIDLNDVEIYPSFDFCDELASKEALRICFEETVTTTFYKSLSTHHFALSKQVHDTIFIDFIVNEKGIYCIDTLKLTTQIRTEVPQLERWVHEACEQLPKAYPARIRDTPVKTRFKIPLIFQTE